MYTTVKKYSTIVKHVQAIQLTKDNVKEVLAFIPEQFKPKQVTSVLNPRIKDQLEDDAVIFIRPLEKGAKPEGIAFDDFVVTESENSLMILNLLEFTNTFVIEEPAHTSE